MRYSIEFDPLDLWVTVYGMVMMPLGGAIYRYGNIRERDNIAGVGFIVVIGGLSFVISGISSLNQYGDVGVCQPYKCPSTRK